jgi:hypothetical protein
MEKTLINLTLPLIYAEIDQVMAADLYCVQSELHDSPGTRQEIANYASRRIQCRYRTLNEMTNDHASSLSLEEALEVEAVVRQGIHQLIHQARLEAISPVAANRSSKLLSSIPALTTSI